MAVALALATCWLPSSAAPVGGEVVALQSAAASCPTGTTDFYIGCTSGAVPAYNGTVTDNRTGLVWLGDPSCFGPLDWSAAVATVAALSDLPSSWDASCGGPADTCDCGLSDGSSPGEWRLPSISEWQAMVAAGIAQGCSPTITTDQGIGCNPATCFSFPAFTCIFQYPEAMPYWSASPDVTDATRAWSIDLADGAVSRSDKDTSQLFVWPVRSGQ